MQRSMLAATVIHSSLLSIGVGAVCLPAAFHFALSYNADALGSGDTTMREQKVDLLMMSHSVGAAFLYVFQRSDSSVTGFLPSLAEYVRASSEDCHAHVIQSTSRI